MSITAIKKCIQVNSIFLMGLFNDDTQTDVRLLQRCLLMFPVLLFFYIYYPIKKIIIKVNIQKSQRERRAAIVLPVLRLC